MKFLIQLMVLIKVNPDPVFRNYNEFINRTLSFSINNSILTLIFDDSKVPKSAVFLPQHLNVHIVSSTNWQDSSSNFNIEVTDPLMGTGNNISTILYRPQNTSSSTYNLTQSDIVGKTFLIKSVTEDIVLLENDWYIDNIHDVTKAVEWNRTGVVYADVNNKYREVNIKYDGDKFKIRWPNVVTQEYIELESITNLNDGTNFTVNNFTTFFPGINNVTFNIVKSTKREVFIQYTISSTGITINLKFANFKNNRDGNLYFCSYNSETDITDSIGSLKAFGSGNLYEIEIKSLNNEYKTNFTDLSFNDIIHVTRKDAENNIVVKYNFRNNFIDGVIGYYHELDSSKTIQNNTGFYNTNIVNSKERVGSYVEQFLNIQWFSNILREVTNQPNLYDTAFNFNLDYNRGEPFGNEDGTYNFLVKSLSSINFSNFTFRNVSFVGTTFTGCEFNNSKLFNCDFTNCTFEACVFEKIYSKDCSFNNYIETINSSKTLPFNHSFLNGKIITKDFSNNYTEYTTINFRDFDGSYNEKTLNIPHEYRDRKIRNFIDLSSSRVDYYNLRSLMTVETGYRFDVSLTQLLINGFNGFETEEAKNNFYLNNKTASSFLNNNKYSPIHQENIERNLNTPVIFLIYETEENLELKNLEEYFNIEIDSPSNEPDISYISKTEILPSVAGFESTILSLYFNDLKNPLISGFYNRIIDENFYEHQFQKDLYNKNAPKLCGVKSTLTTDFAHNGNWEILQHPYNSFNKVNTLCTYGEQTLNTSNKNIDNIAGIQGPLAYYQIDISYTSQILSDYPTNPSTINHFSRFSSLRIRKVNPNYKYTESSTNDSRKKFLDTGTQDIEHQVFSYYDLSYGQPDNPKYYSMIDNVI